MPTVMPRSFARGFSLVELSIVLVILGLLTGGILAGQSLIRAAELRSVVSDCQRYVTAAQSFRDRYMALPGDMANATRFWARQVNAAHCVTNSSAAVGTPGVCDGNGDGSIDAAAAASQSGEQYQFWNHLADAGLIEGSYTGLAGSGGVNHHTPGTNTPMPRLSSAGWRAGASNNGTGDTQLFAIVMGNYLEFGATVTNSAPFGKILRPEEAWGMDTKMDDGKPAYGKLIARYWNNECSAADDGSSANNDRNASYRLTDTTAQCALYFINAF